MVPPPALSFVAAHRSLDSSLPAGKAGLRPVTKTRRSSGLIDNSALLAT